MSITPEQKEICRLRVEKAVGDLNNVLRDVYRFGLRGSVSSAGSEDCQTVKVRLMLPVNFVDFGQVGGRMTAPRRASRRHPAMMKHRDHARLWRLVEGAVVDTFRCHPGYLTEAGSRSAVQSISKRVVGQLVGHAKQAQERGRPSPDGGGSGGGAEISGTASGAGRHLLPPSRTRFPQLHAVLCGDAL